MISKNFTVIFILAWILVICQARNKIVSGRMSTFGGPNDTGVRPNEGLALYSRVSQRPEVFLTYQPQGTTGLARRLDPSKYYIALRWNYGQTSKSYLRGILVTVSANGKSANAYPVDWGPNARTGRVADLSPGLATYLGLATDNQVTVQVPLP